MDSYQRLIEDLPARLPPGRSQRASEKAIRETAAALPLANPAQAAREVEQVLDGMLATTWAGAERLAALEHLRAPVGSLCDGIERQLAAEPHPLSAAATERATSAVTAAGRPRKIATSPSTSERSSRLACIAFPRVIQVGSDGLHAPEHSPQAMRLGQSKFDLHQACLLTPKG